MKFTSITCIVRLKKLDSKMAALRLILEFETTYQNAKAIKEFKMGDIFGINTDSCGRKRGILGVKK